MILHTSIENVNTQCRIFDGNDTSEAGHEAERQYRDGFLRSADLSSRVLASPDLSSVEMLEWIEDLARDVDEATEAAGSESAKLRGRRHGLVSAKYLVECEFRRSVAMRGDRELSDAEYAQEADRELTRLREHLPAFQQWLEAVRTWAARDCGSIEFIPFFFEVVKLDPVDSGSKEFEELNAEQLNDSKACAVASATKHQFRPVFGVTLDQIWNPGGLIQEIIDYNLRTAHRRQPELALAGAIAVVATIAGRKVTDASGVCPNIYLIGVGASGCGKEQARKVNKALLFTASADEMAKDSLASSAGLHTALSHHPSLLLQIDEFGRFMATLGNPGNSPHLSQIVDVLLKLYSQSDSVYSAPCYGDIRKNVRILFPNCVMYATTVPASFFNSLTREALSDGFISRLLIVEAANNDPDSQEPESLDVPDSIREAVRWWIDHVPCNEGGLPSSRKLAISPEARAAYSQLDAIVRKNRRAEETRGTQIWVRCVENARKLALINQCSLDRESTAITGEAARWGCEFALMLTSRIEQLANEHVSDGAFDARGQKIMRFVRAAGPEGRTRSELSRHVRNASKRELDETLAKLIEMEQMTMQIYQPAKGPAGQRFWSIA